MTIDERLERLITIAERQDQQIETHSKQISDLRSAVASLLEIVEQHQQNFEVIVAEIREIKAEIRGIQTENQRILDRLSGSQDS